MTGRSVPAHRVAAEARAERQRVQAKEREVERERERAKHEKRSAQAEAESLVLLQHARPAFALIFAASAGELWLRPCVSWQQSTSWRLPWLAMPRVRNCLQTLQKCGARVRVAW